LEELLEHVLAAVRPHHRMAEPEIVRQAQPLAGARVVRAHHADQGAVEQLLLEEAGLLLQVGEIAERELGRAALQYLGRRGGRPIARRRAPGASSARRASRRGTKLISPISGVTIVKTCSVRAGWKPRRWSTSSLTVSITRRTGSTSSWARALSRISPPPRRNS